MDVLWPPQSRRSPSWLGYAEQRDALIKSGWKAIQNSEDPAIVAARELVILMRKNEKLGDELDAKEEALGAELGQALLACYGTNVGSDGTMTPRFTDGVVRGFQTSSGIGGTLAPYRTTFYGLYARNAEFDNEYPFNLPKIWLDRKDKIDMTKSVNFVSTNDINGGNAGSRRQVTRKDSHGGRFPSPIRPEKTHNFPFVYPEADPVYGMKRPIGLGQSLHFDHRADSPAVTR